MCNACGFYCCASDSFGGCGCDCRVAGCRECEDCGADEILGDGHRKGCPSVIGLGDDDDAEYGEHHDDCGCDYCVGGYEEAVE